MLPCFVSVVPLSNELTDIGGFEFKVLSLPVELLEKNDPPVAFGGALAPLPNIPVLEDEVALPPNNPPVPAIILFLL